MGDVAPLVGAGRPAFGLGAAPLGNLFQAISDEDAYAIVEVALSRSVSFFDTAPLYGYGLSERRLGEALSAVPRDSYCLATKVGLSLVPGTPDESFVDVPSLTVEKDYSRDAVLRGLEASMARLGVDHVDVVHVHEPSTAEDALAEALPALYELRAEGVIGAVGAGMNDPEPLAQLIREGDLDAALIAGRWTLLDQSAADELLPLAQQRGVAVIAAGVFNSGLLAAPREDARFFYDRVPADMLARAHALRAVCARHGTTLATAAVQFAMLHPAVTSLLVGAQTVAELDDDLDAWEADIAPALWSDLVAEGLLPADLPLTVPLENP